MRPLASLSVLVAVACTPKGKNAPEPAVPAFGGTVIQGPLDARSYELVRLDNGIRALLVSDPDTDMAAASLFVHVGHYADPSDRQGLAHFLEHMLFMGTDKYPDVEEYRRFVEDHGGMTNAGTSAESTQYFFQVEQGSLAGAFDRFAQFFVAPRLDPQYVERERNAVHSEYSLKIQDDARRARQVRKSTTNPDHPESKFSVGSLETLADREGDAVLDDLRALYTAEYRPDRMTVAILGRESLDDLRKMVADGLAGVTGPAPTPDAARPSPFLPDQLGARIDVVPLDVRRELEIQFPLPPDDQHWPVRPISYVSSILGHEGDGTLFAALKGAGWIERLRAGPDDPADDYDLMSIDIGLTEAGAEHVDEIVSAVFAGIGQIGERGVEPFRIEERRTIGELGFRFGEESRPVDAVQAAARSLYYYPPEHVLDHWSQLGDLPPEMLGSTIAALTPENMRLVVTRPDVQTDRVEPLYDVPYAVRPLTGEEKAAFLSGTALSFAPPPPNPYLPERTDLVADGGQAIPVRLSGEGDRLELWHLADPSFGVPRALGVIELWSPSPGVDTRARVLTALYDRLLNDSLQEFRYPLDEAGLGFSVSGDEQGLSVRFWGYDDRQERMVRDLCERIASFSLDEERFEIQRARAVREWRNYGRDRPISQARRAEYEALYPRAFQRDAAIAIGEALTFDEMSAFVDGFLDHVSARLFLHGNLGEDRARALSTTVTETLLASAKDAPRPEVAVRTLEPGKTLVRDVDIDHNDSTLVVVYQGQKNDVDSHARWMLLGQLLDTPFFTQLRTEQQLGYVVSAGYARFDRLPGLRMAIQSGVAGPVTLLERVDTFVGAQHQQIAEMPADAFETLRAGLVAKLRERDTQLYQRSSRLADDLEAGVQSFDWNEQVAVAIEKLDRETMAAFYAEMLTSGGAGRLVVRSFGSGHTGERGLAAVGCPDTACVADQLGNLWKRRL